MDRNLTSGSSHPPRRHGARRPRGGLTRPLGKLRAFAVAAFAFLTIGRPVWAQKPSTEYQVKAAFLLNFAEFVEWPAGAFPNARDPITICVYGFDPFGSLLNDLIREKPGSHELRARHVENLSALRVCQIVFVSEREDKSLPDVKNSVKEGNVLLVGEGKDFADRGGTIQFFLQDSRLRFAVNVDEAQRAGLTVSSKLLSLAKIVHDTTHQGSGHAPEK